MSNIVSVLMATYAGETASERSLESMFAQTQAPNELVLVVDGPIGEEQMVIIENTIKTTNTEMMRRPYAHQSCFGSALKLGSCPLHGQVDYANGQ